jgi:hypothetical protein
MVYFCTNIVISHMLIATLSPLNTAKVIVSNALAKTDNPYKQGDK